MMVRRRLLTALMAWPAMLLAHGDVAHQDATLDSARYEQRIGHRIPSGLVFADESTELEFPDRELRMLDAVDYSADVQPGEYVEEPMESLSLIHI